MFSLRSKSIFNSISFLYQSQRCCLQTTNKIAKSNSVKWYLISKGSKLVEDYEKVLQKRFPKTFNLYQVFSFGARDVYRDIITYYKVQSHLKSGKSTEVLVRHDLEKYNQTRRDMKKAMSIIVVIAVPFANYVFLPLALLYPQILTHHFWNIKQRIDFSLKKLQKEFKYHPPILDQLHLKVSHIPDPLLAKSFNDLLTMLANGDQPTEENILKVMPLFSDTLNIKNLTPTHQNLLCRLHSISPFFNKKHKLIHYAGILHEMDLAMIREGIDKLNMDELRRCCFIRGINPLTLPQKELVSYLELWTSVSAHIRCQNLSTIVRSKQKDCQGLSLLLHCPIFLAHNQASNWMIRKT